MRNNICDVAQVGICNCCGKEFNEDSLYSTDAAFSYGSKYDGNLLDIKFCVYCLDKVVDMLVDFCVISPVVEGYCGYDECEEDLELVETV